MSRKWLNFLFVACIVALLISFSLAAPSKDEQDDYEDDSDEPEVTTTSTQSPRHHHHVHVHRKPSTTAKPPSSSSKSKVSSNSRASSIQSTKTTKKPDEQFADEARAAEDVLEEAKKAVGPNLSLKNLKKSLARTSKSKPARSTTTTVEPSSESDSESDGTSRSDLAESEGESRFFLPWFNRRKRARTTTLKPAKLPPSSPLSNQKSEITSTPTSVKPPVVVPAQVFPEDDDSKDLDSDYNEEGEFHPKNCSDTSAKPSEKPTRKPEAGTSSKPKVNTPNKQSGPQNSQKAQSQQKPLQPSAASPLQGGKKHIG